MAKEIKKQAEEATKVIDMQAKKEVLPLGKINFIMIAVCVLLIMLGFFLMTGSANTGTTWNEDVFNTTRTVVGPMVALAGFTLENRLEQEMIYYLEKLDITEEKIRLRQHLDYFLQCLAQGECQWRRNELASLPFFCLH